MDLKRKSLGDLVSEMVDKTVDHQSNIVYLGAKHDRHSQRTLSAMRENYAQEMAAYKTELDRREKVYTTLCPHERE